MPNHVANWFSVRGPAEEVQRFHQSVNWDSNAEDGGFCRSLIPFPKELHGPVVLDENGEPLFRTFSAEGRIWCDTQWGTKWGDYDTEVIHEPGPLHTWHECKSFTAAYRYTTAWGPAVEAIETIGKMFPELIFEVSWEEEGNQSGGVQLVKGDINVVEWARTTEFPSPVNHDGPDWMEDLSRYLDEWEDMMSQVEDRAHHLFNELRGF